MPASRNPFLIRTAEQAESDDQFLSLFSLEVLDVLPEDGSWNRSFPIQWAPGSGEVDLAASIYSDRAEEHCKSAEPT